MSELPDTLKYSPSHEWVRDEGDGSVTLGITAFAQEQLGDLVYVDLPQVGGRIVAEGEIGVVESVKAASDLFSPFAGEVVAVNEALNGSPEQVNEDPYGEGWIVRIRLDDPAALEGLLDAEGYAKLLEEEG